MIYMANTSSTIGGGGLEGGSLSYPASVLTHSATHYNTLQHTAIRCNILQHVSTIDGGGLEGESLQYPATHSVTHCYTL